MSWKVGDWTFGPADAYTNLLYAIAHQAFVDARDGDEIAGTFLSCSMIKEYLGDWISKGIQGGRIRISVQ